MCLCRTRGPLRPRRIDRKTPVIFLSLQEIKLSKSHFGVMFLLLYLKGRVSRKVSVGYVSASLDVFGIRIDAPGRTPGATASEGMSPHERPAGFRLSISACRPNQPVCLTGRVDRFFYVPPFPE